MCLYYQFICLFGVPFSEKGVRDALYTPYGYVYAVTGHNKGFQYNFDATMENKTDSCVTSKFQEWKILGSTSIDFQIAIHFIGNKENTPYSYLFANTGHSHKI